MKVFELTSGFIAAVVIALGVYSYVNDTKVEEKPVVKETTEKEGSKVEEATFEDAWFVYNLTSKDREDVETPGNYSVNPAGPEVEPGCNGTNNLCAIRAPRNGSEPDLSDEAFVDEIMEILDDPLTHSNPDVKLQP